MSFNSLIRIIVLISAITAISCSGGFYDYSLEYGYLKANYEVFNPSVSGGPEMIRRYADMDVFFIGEIHGVSSNREVCMRVLKELKSASGLKDFIGEIGYSSGYYLNEYISGGDEKLLDDLVRKSAGTYFGTEETAWFFRELRDLNGALAESDRIIFHGIDIDHQPEIPVKHLLEMDEDFSAEPPAVLKTALAYFAGVLAGEESSLSDLYDSINPVYEDILRYPASYSAYAGDTAGYRDLTMTVRNMRNGLYWYVVDQFRTERDVFIYENFTGIYESGRKYLGLWGNAHTPLVPFDPERPLIAAMLQNRTDSPVKGRVFSVLLLYHDSRTLNKTDYSRPLPVPESPLVSGRFLRVCGEPYSIYDLAAAGSPFLNAESLMISPGGKGVSADYYRMCIFINGADSAAVYGDG